MSKFLKFNLLEKRKSIAAVVQRKLLTIHEQRRRSWTHTLAANGKASKSFPVRRFSPTSSEHSRGWTVRLEKQREWQTKDLGLGTLCPLELIRKRDFEIVMILCLRRFSPGERATVDQKEENEEEQRKRIGCRDQDTKGESPRGGMSWRETRRQAERSLDEEGAASSDVTGGWSVISRVKLFTQRENRRGEIGWRRTTYSRKRWDSEGKRSGRTTKYEECNVLQFAIPFTGFHSGMSDGIIRIPGRKTECETCRELYWC